MNFWKQISSFVFPPAYSSPPTQEAAAKKKKKKPVWSVRTHWLIHKQMSPIGGGDN